MGQSKRTNNSKSISLWLRKDTEVWIAHNFLAVFQIAKLRFLVACGLL